MDVIWILPFPTDDSLMLDIGVAAFDLCVALMELGEISEVVTDPKYAYGPSGK